MRRPTTMLIRLLLAALLLPACQSGAEPGPTTSGESAPAASPSEGEEATRRVAPGAFDGLTVTLDLNASSVRSGSQIGSRLTVSNDSGSTIVDPGCVIGSGRSALVPIDDPEAELWLQPVVDCSGPYEMRGGYRDRSSGPTFFARTKLGEPLPPGDYIAVLEIEGYSERFEVPVKVD